MPVGGEEGARKGQRARERTQESEETEQGHKSCIYVRDYR